MESKSINCIIVDDEPLSASLLESYCNSNNITTLQQKFTNPIEALHYLENNKTDLIFLDIQMPELTGIQFMKILKKKCLVVLTTAYPEYAVDAFDLDVTDYLLKPITYARFMQAINKVEEKFKAIKIVNNNTTKDNFIYIKCDRKLIKIFFDDITYLEGLRDYVAIYTKSGKILTLQSLRNFEETLPANKFARIHKSYIININAITSLESKSVTIDKLSIPIGNVYAQNLNFLKETN